MMKKSIMGLVFLAVSITNLFSVEIQGFRDFKWGSAPSVDMVIIDKHDQTKEIKYKKLNENLKIGNIEIKSVIYFYFDNQLEAIRVTSGKKEFEDISEILVAKYGGNTAPILIGDGYKWTSKSGEISIEDDLHGEVTIIFIGHKIDKQKMLYEKKLIKQAADEI